MLELRFCKPANNSICNIPNSRLKGEEVFWQAVVADFVLEKLDQMPSNGLRGCIRWRIGYCLILIIRFNDCYNLLAVNGNICSRLTEELAFSQMGVFGSAFFARFRRKTKIGKGIPPNTYVPMRSSGAMMRYGFRCGGSCVIVISCRPLISGMAVLTSTIIYEATLAFGIWLRTRLIFPNQPCLPSV
jgi:hypothetical protein